MNFKFERKLIIMAKEITAADALGLIKGIANISPETREHAKEVVTEFGTIIANNRKAHDEYVVAKTLMPLFVEALKKNKTGDKLISALSKKTKGDNRLYVQSSQWGKIIDTLNDRHAFNEALSRAGVKLHGRKLKNEQGEININNVDWKNIENMLNQKGRGGSKLRKTIHDLANPTEDNTPS